MKQWITTGSICGILSMVFYLSAAFAPLPEILSVSLAFHFGILLSVAFIGLYHYFKSTTGDSFTIVLMKYSGVIAGVMVTTMLVVQQALFFTKDKMIQESRVDEVALRTMMTLVNTVHLGLDITWDLFISWAGILLGIAMVRKKSYFIVAGLLIIGINSALLIFNLYTFPTPPGDAGLVDVGPIVALSYIFIFSYVLIQSRRLARA